VFIQEKRNNAQGLETFRMWPRPTSKPLKYVPLIPGFVVVLVAFSLHVKCQKSSRTPCIN